MIPGYNTDIEFDGTIYHVQTEDKGLKARLIVSLVYVGGEILASKRTSYDDLMIDGKVDEAALIERLQRQHKLICAAIRAGRIEDLRRMGKQMGADGNGASAHKGKRRGGESGALKKKAQSADATVEVAPRFAPHPANGSESSAWLDLPASSVDDLQLSLLEERDFRAGETVVLSVRVGYGPSCAIPNAFVKVKILGTTFRPTIFNTRTDHNGIATLRLMIPHFTAGRAAILIEASADGHRAELRRLIHHA